MGFGANFTKVTLSTNGHGTNVLQVEGQSDPEMLRRVSEMHVAVIGRPEAILPAGGAKAEAAVEAPRRASVAHVNASADWRVAVPQDAPAPENVLVLGLAVLSPAADGDELVSPFYWSMTLPVAR